MTDTILKTWPISLTAEVRLVENEAWNLDTAADEYRYRVVTVRGGVEGDEATFDDYEDAAREGRIRARVLVEDCEDDSPGNSGEGA
jgi:hypothetical protein